MEDGTINHDGGSMGAVVSEAMAETDRLAHLEKAERMIPNTSLMPWDELMDADELILKGKEKRAEIIHHMSSK